MTRHALAVFLDGRHAGTLDSIGGPLGFTYTDEWLAHSHSYPLSTAFPLERAEHSRKVDEFLWGLLPDNQGVIQRWSREFGVNARSVLQILGTPVGRDVSGAAVFVPLHEAADFDPTEGGVKLLSKQDIEHRLDELSERPSTWTPSDITAGQFSLAGAQAKIALSQDDSGQWGAPYGAEPTTHILKPSIAHFSGQDVCEHVSLQAASLTGIAASQSWIGHFGARRALVVRRYDRVADTTGAMVRVHQEDFCQAMLVHPMKKYATDGGPSARDMIRKLRQVSTEVEQDTDELIRRLAFNVVIEGTDAHAKNYSMLIAPHAVTLAPAYDLNSYTPWRNSAEQTRLAQPIGKESDPRRVREKHWAALARAAGIDEDRVLENVRATFERVPEAWSQACEEASRDGLDVAHLAATQQRVEQNWSVFRGGVSITLPTSFAGAAAPVSHDAHTGQTWVKPYVRSDGTSVQGHWRQGRV